MIIGARPDALMPSMSLHCMLCLYIAVGLQVSQYSSVVSALLYLSHSFLLPLRYHDAARQQQCYCTAGSRGRLLLRTSLFVPTSNAHGRRTGSFVHYIAGFFSCLLFQCSSMNWFCPNQSNVKKVKFLRTSKSSLGYSFLLGFFMFIRIHLPFNWKTLLPTALLYCTNQIVKQAFV